jgi:hypothetical protein
MPGVDPDGEVGAIVVVVMNASFDTHEHARAVNSQLD